MKRKLKAAIATIEQQLERGGARYGRASLEVLGRQVEIWAYRAVKRMPLKVKLYNRYVYKIDGVRVDHRAVGALFKQEEGL